MLVIEIALLGIGILIVLKSYLPDVIDSLKNTRNQGLKEGRKNK